MNGHAVKPPVIVTVTVSASIHMRLKERAGDKMQQKGQSFAVSCTTDSDGVVCMCAFQTNSL